MIYLELMTFRSLWNPGMHNGCDSNRVKARIALRVNGVVRWLLRDHLGSTTVTANGASGERTAELWYKPWGENRGTPVGATPTQRRFTGQVLDEVAGGTVSLNLTGWAQE